MADLETIDLRSDTVTRPDPAMLRAMTEAPLGDDVFGDDPTVKLLEERAAEVVGKEAALFVPSGTMGNSIAVSLHCRPGDEMILERSSHTYNFEGGGPARLWGVQASTIEAPSGRIPVSAIRAAIRPADIHMPRTRLVVLEETHNLSGGRVLPIEYIDEVGAFCRSAGLALHIDGARIFNAAVALGRPAAEIARAADSVMFCISKGLGAPVGSLLCGRREFIAEGRRVRKVLGGGMRQAGLLAACGLHALATNIDRLAEDHARARALGEALLAIPAIEVRPRPIETNMVYVGIAREGPETIDRLAEGLRRRGVLAAKIGRSVRFVFHKDIDAAMALNAVGKIREAVLEALGRH
jgi:threonine aldolase